MVQLPNRSYSKDFKKELLKEFAASNKGPKEFAAEKNIPLQTFYHWRKYPDRSTSVKKTSKSSFAPISVQDPIRSISEEITITYPNGVEVKLPSTVDVAIISSLVKQF